MAVSSPAWYRAAAVVGAVGWGRGRGRRKAPFQTAFARLGKPLQARRGGAMIAALHRARRRVVMKETS